MHVFPITIGKSSFLCNKSVSWTSGSSAGNLSTISLKMMVRWLSLIFSMRQNSLKKKIWKNLGHGYRGLLPPEYIGPDYTLSPVWCKQWFRRVENPDSGQLKTIIPVVWKPNFYNDCMHNTVQIIMKGGHQMTKYRVAKSSYPAQSVYRSYCHLMFHLSIFPHHQSIYVFTEKAIKKELLPLPKKQWAIFEPI